MKKEYSFKSSSRRINTQNDYSQNNDYTSNKLSREAWTDMRIQQIKKKYQTPSYNRKSHNSYQQNDENKNPRLFQANDMFTPTKKYLQQLSSNSFRKGQKLKEEKSNRKQCAQNENRNYRLSTHQEEIMPSFGSEIRNQRQESYNHHSPSFSNNQNYYRSKKYIPKSSTAYKVNSQSAINNSSRSANQNRLMKEHSQEMNDYRQYPKNKIDPRVENIDKINMKIKSILQCLHQNENYILKNQLAHNKHGFLQKEERSYSYDMISNKQQKSLKGSAFKMINDYEVLSRGEHSEELEQTKILSRQKICADHNKILNKKEETRNQSPVCKIFQSRNRNYQTPSANKSIIHDHNLAGSAYKKQQVDIDIQKKDKSSFNKVQKSSCNWFEEKKEAIVGNGINRSKSCLEGFKDNSIRLSNGKKVDDQISKINTRIRQFEEEKKKLSIEFKPYNYDIKINKPARDNCNYQKPNTSVSAINSEKALKGHRPPLPKARASQLGHRYQRSSITLQNFHNQRVRTETNYCRQNEHQSQSSTPRIKKANDFKLEQSRSQKDQQQGRTSIGQKVLFRNPSFRKDINESEISQKSDQQLKLKQELENRKRHELSDKTTQGIMNRKQKLLNIETTTVSFARETKRLIQSLFQQAKIDEQLRNAKIWLRDFCFDANKWATLEKLIKKNSLAVNNDIRVQFEVTEEEDNPFYSAREQGQGSYEGLLEIWNKADKNWKNTILKSYSLKQFAAEKFTCDKIDLQKKGYFSVEDLVRFINMETGTFYRNRDLILIFRRLTRGSKLAWADFLAQLDQQLSEQRATVRQNSIEAQKRSNSLRSNESKGFIEDL